MPSTNRCVFGCDTTGVTVHNFPHPVNNPEIFKIWLEVIGKPIKGMSSVKIYNNKKVCDRHFTENVKNRNSRLNVLAIPTLHLPNQPIILCHTDDVQQNLESTQQLTVTGNQMENNNEEHNNETTTTNDIGKTKADKSIECNEIEILASYEHLFKDVEVQTDYVPSDEPDKRTEIEVANEQFGSFVARELDTVPELKRRQIIREIVNLLADN